ncbi:MAG: dephospho-CoA kinase [Planctomycetota bacterium]
MPSEKFVVGLVGQVCAGKSTVADAFRHLGARVFDADKAVHDMYTRPDVIAEVTAMFGPSVLDEAGNVDRKALGKIVFNDRKQLKRLTTEIVFPRTDAAIKAAIEAFRTSDASALVIDAPSLFESGCQDLCDTIVYVSAPQERREMWASKRGWLPGELSRRDSMLENDEGKRLRADAIIVNDGTLDNVEKQTGRLMRLWTMQH